MRQSGSEHRCGSYPKAKQTKVCAMNMFTDPRRSRRTGPPCRSVLAHPSAAFDVPRSGTLFATPSRALNQDRINLPRETGRILLNCRNLRNFPFTVSKTESHIISCSKTRLYRAVPPNRKNISAAIDFLDPRRGLSRFLSTTLFFPAQLLDFMNLTLFSIHRSECHQSAPECGLPSFSGSAQWAISRFGS